MILRQVSVLLILDFERKNLYFLQKPCRKNKNVFVVFQIFFVMCRPGTVREEMEIYQTLEFTHNTKARCNLRK